MQSFYHLDQLIQGYFNQDHDIINDDKDTVEGIIGLFIKAAPEWMLKELIEEVDDFIDSYKGHLNEEFKTDMATIFHRSFGKRQLMTS